MTITKSLVAFAILSMTVSVHAAITYGSNNAGTLYAGIKTGLVDADLGKKSVVYGVYGGYNYDQNLGAEAEYVTSFDKKFGADNQTREYGVSSLGAYGTYRYHFLNTPFYAKGRLGIAKTEIEVKNVDGGSYSSTSDKIGFGYGIGAGYQLDNLGIEASYNKTSDIGVLGVGATMNF